MKTTCTVAKGVEVKSGESGLVEIVLGTTGRVVNGKLLTCAIQNAKNVGFKPDPFIEVSTKLIEYEEETRAVIVKNSAESVKNVIVSIDTSIQEEVSGDDLLKAVQKCTT